MLYFESEQFLKELKDTLLFYLPNVYDPDPEEHKQKRVNVIRREYNRCSNKEFDEIYDVQMQAIVLLNQIDSSHILALNDVILPHLVLEYKELKRLLVLLNAELRRMNQFQEIKSFIPVIKPKDLDSYLYNDLTTVITEFNIDCDIKELMRT